MKTISGLVKESKIRRTEGNAKVDPSMSADKLITAWKLWVPANWAKEGKSD